MLPLQNIDDSVFYRWLFSGRYEIFCDTLTARALVSSCYTFYLCSERSQETLQESFESLSSHTHVHENGPYPLKFWIWLSITNNCNSVWQRIPHKKNFYKAKASCSVLTWPQWQYWRHYKLEWQPVAFDASGYLNLAPCREIYFVFRSRLWIISYFRENN